MKNLLITMFVTLLMAGCGGRDLEDKPTDQQIAAEKETKEWGEWEANPEPYGGLEVLAKIRGAVESNATYLALNKSQITDLTPLPALTELERLHLSSNKITDLTATANLTKLTELDLSHNKITDLTPLAGLTELKRMDLGSNQITDIAPLAGLTKLEELHLHKNPIPDDQKAMLRNALPNCDIRFD